MKTTFIFCAAAAATVAAAAISAGPALARPTSTPVQSPQQVMSLDLGACTPPVYPAAALALHASGKTTVEVQIDAQGLAGEARVSASSGRTDLDEAALASIRRCVFYAVLATGQAPTGWLKTQYVWVVDPVRPADAQGQALLASTTALAQGGDPVAQNRLGAWYEHGSHVKQDMVQAAAWYLLAAQSGNAVAQNNLGVLSIRGAGVDKDPKQAVYWYAKAAEQGHGWAQANLAWAYQYGTAGERDADKALYWLTRSAEGGLAPAQARLGVMAMRRAGSEEERIAAAAWLARAAAQNDPYGRYLLGRSFALGLGNPQDSVQAALEYRKALGRSEGRAEVALGNLIEAGQGGAADPSEAAALYQRAIRWHYPAAFYHFGLVLEGRGEDALALGLFRQGAELGSCEAVLKYVQLSQAQPTPSVDGKPGADWQQRAAACAARPQLPAQL